MNPAISWYIVATVMMNLICSQALQQHAELKKVFLSIIPVSPIFMSLLHQRHAYCVAVNIHHYYIIISCNVIHL